MINIIRKELESRVKTSHPFTKNDYIIILL